MSESVMKMLNSTNEQEFIKASELLIKYADNILSDPSNMKYRKIKSSNENVKTIISKIPGGIECFHEMGFLLENDFYVLPKETPLTKLEMIKEDLKKRNDQIKQTKLPKNEPTVKNLKINPNINLLSTSERVFYERIVRQFDHMFVYEDPHLLQKARNMMNYEKLKDNSKLKIEKAKLDPSYLEEIMLIELLDWFKNDFFKWMNKPECSICKQTTILFNNPAPTFEELSFGAQRVENYKCQTCGQFIRFPRYNDPGKLLETREGRCGEWANCFVLCCRALSFDTRYILDVGDHVWAEVFSSRQQRWMHCDPCENVCDKPLLYEKGWGKKLTYVLAFSLNDLQDVTWRYTSDHKDLLSRRRECREDWLVGVINQLRKRRFTSLNLPASTQNNLFKRTTLELVELMTEAKGSSENFSGRTTGSMEWRRMRGEMGSSSTFQPVIISPNQSELNKNCIKISYCCSKDSYSRSDGEVLNGWESLLNIEENMIRKEERDWKKSYLCRRAGSEMGRIGWKMELEECGKRVHGGQVFVDSQCFENGQVEWKLTNDSGVIINIHQGLNTDISAISGSKSVQLTATLSKGKGENDWQHVQLFRQDLNSDESLLKLEFLLK